MTTTATSDLLETIVAATRRSVEVRAASQPLSALERGTVRRPGGAAFAAALRDPAAPRIIAECKRRSPSRGILRANYQPGMHAASYAAAGAAAISVLTEPTFFDGSLEHLREVRRAVTVPLLRKDFIVTEYQLAEAVQAGADAVLLIVAALEQAELRALIRGAADRGLAALVEVHDVTEIPRAADAGARIVGVNSRDLRTLRVDPAVLENAARVLPAGVLAVAESGIRERADIERLTALGYHAVLVGERLITESDPGAALAELRERLRPERGAGGKPAAGRPPSESERGWGPASTDK
jgi:indole-3-glycerol phosphate synthase